MILNSKIRKQGNGHVYSTFLNFRIIFFCFFCVSSEARFQRLSSSSSGQEDFENELVGIQGMVVFVARRAEGTCSLAVMIDGGLDSCTGSAT